MRVSIFGGGYVGLVTGICFAERGHTVVCADCDVSKIAQLNAGQTCIYEPGLDALLARHLQKGQITFSTDLPATVRASAVCMIAVGTPSNEDGSANLTAVENVADHIAQNMVRYMLVIIKSTAPVGTARRVRHRMMLILGNRGCNIPFDVVSNPEFLKEGTAISDCLHPDRIVLGCDPSPTYKQSQMLLRSLYAEATANGTPCLWMGTLSSELTKYTANAMLAARISLINEISSVCDALGADIQDVRRGIAADPRIGAHYIEPGIGYGGSCFAKDIAALIQTAEEASVSLPMLQAVRKGNVQQRERFFARIRTHFKENLAGKKIAIWGLAFKPGTDDVREASALCIIRRLLQAGACVSAYDPVAADKAKIALFGLPNVTFAQDACSAVLAADALCIMTEWPEFAEADLVYVSTLMRRTVIFDGRHILRDDAVQALDDVQYISLGRPDIVKKRLGPICLSANLETHGVWDLNNEKAGNAAS